MILSHHQVMASFLDFVFTFRVREQPHSFTSFHHQNYLGSHHSQPGLSSMGRSGIVIQHCFNLLGIEYDRKQWLQRQTAAYHSFDLVQGRALWIILKGNATIRDRFQEASKETAENHPQILNGVGDSFAQSLMDHLLLLQWSVENWASYAEYLQEKCRPFETVTNVVPAQRIIEQESTMRKFDRMASMSFRPQSRTVSGYLRSALPSSLRKIWSEVGGHHNTKSISANGMPLQIMPSQPTDSGNKNIHIPIKGRRQPEVGLEKLVNLDSLQSLCRLGTELNQAIAIITQNKRIMVEINAHYQSITDSDAFELHVRDQAEIQSCRRHTADFLQQVTRLEADLGNYQSHFVTLLNAVEKATSTVRCENSED